MARALLLLFLLPLLSHLLLNVSVSTSGSDGLPDILLTDMKPVVLEKGKIVSWAPIRFYWHDTSAGSDPSAVEVARSATPRSNNFGTIRVMDDPLTIGPNRSSLLIGKSQGIYLSADKSTRGLFMAMTLTFTGTEYGGSSLTVVGRNELNKPEREMPITGGTGLFQYATGYVRIRTYSFDPRDRYTVVEYTCNFTTLTNHISPPAE